MSNLGSSLLDTNQLTSAEIYSLFEKANRLEACFGRTGGFSQSFTDGGVTVQNKVVACLFLEASTRTRISFQMATYRLGAKIILLEAGPASSLSKGETYSDTVLNIEAMHPDVLVVRYGDAPELDRILPRLSMPVLNAGSGKRAHPTQALLDAYTIFRERGKIENERVLIVGDIVHSRVARSNIDVLQKMGAQVAFSGPPDFLPESEEFPRAQIFKNLEEGLKWASVCMGLRVQQERHSAGQSFAGAFDAIAYHSEFGLNQNRLALFAKDGILMHPGPIHHGVEFSSEILQDPRAKILQQVSNGVLIRGALLAKALNLETK